jgi:hypothetical protein
MPVSGVPATRRLASQTSRPFEPFEFRHLFLFSVQNFGI